VSEPQFVHVAAPSSAAALALSLSNEIHLDQLQQLEPAFHSIAIFDQQMVYDYIAVVSQRQFEDACFVA
jgi:hypothetical protein